MEKNSSKIISAMQPVVTNKYLFIFVMLSSLIPAPFYFFKQFSFYTATGLTILFAVIIIWGIYLVIKYNPKIVELNNNQITFYGRPEKLTLPVSEVIKVHAHESFWNKLNATLKLEIVTSNRTIYVTTKWFDFDKLKLLMSYTGRG